MVFEIYAFPGVERETEDSDFCWGDWLFLVIERVYVGVV
jgi:hypothetical protein